MDRSTVQILKRKRNDTPRTFKEAILAQIAFEGLSRIYLLLCSLQHVVSVVTLKIAEIISFAHVPTLKTFCLTSCINATYIGQLGIGILTLKKYGFKH